MLRSLCFVLCLCPRLIAEDRLRGTVRDESGAAVAGATVRLEAQAGAGHHVTVSGADGRFELPLLPTRQALVTVEAPAFERAVEPLGDPAREVTITLRVHALAQTVAVTATGYREDVEDSPRAITVLTSAQLDRRLEFSVAESLREVPGVRIQQLGGPGSLTSIRLRGLRAQDTSILIDGMRFRDPAAITSDASAYTAELLTLNVSRIEVLRGGGSSLYGSNSMGGAVNIISGSGGGPLRGDILAEGGGLGFFRGQARVSGGAREDRLTYSAGLSHVNVVTGNDGDDRARNSGAQGYLQYRPGSTLLLSARLSANNSFVGLNLSPSLTVNAPRTGAINAIPLPDSEVALRDRGLPFTLGNANVFPSANDPDSRRASWITSALFAADQQLSPTLHYRVAYQVLDVRRAFPNGPGGTGFQPQVRDFTESTGRIDTAQGRLNYTGGRQIAAAGLEFEREAFDNGGTSFALTPAANSTYRARVAQRSWAVYGEDRWRFLGSRLQFTLSGRMQQFSLQRPQLTGGTPAYLAAPIPQPPRAITGDASAVYRFSRTNTKLRAHVGNAYRAASLYERYGTGFFAGTFTPYGDPRLAPERSLGGDAGIDQLLGARRARLSATYFYTQLRSVIGFDFSGLVNRTTDPFGRSSGYFNTAGGLARGVELEGQVALWRGFQLTASYTHTRTQERQAVAAGTLRTPRIYAHSYAFAASQTWRRWTLTSNFFGAPEYLGVISGRAVYWPGPRRWDATGAYRLSASERWKPELFLRGENLLGQRYYEDGFRTPRRWAVAGLRLSF